MRSALSRGRVVKAHGSLLALSERSESNGSTALAPQHAAAGFAAALADAKADPAKAEATVESLVTAAKKAV